MTEEVLFTQLPKRKWAGATYYPAWWANSKETGRSRIQKRRVFKTFFKNVKLCSLNHMLPSHALRISQITRGNTATTQEFLTQSSNQQMGDCRFPVVCTKAPCVAKSSDQCYLTWPTWIFLTFWTFFLPVLLYRNILQPCFIFTAFSQLQHG